jgi:RNA polymerase sigma-70 factor (ECF subfamily)
MRRRRAEPIDGAVETDQFDPDPGTSDRPTRLLVGARHDPSLLGEFFTLQYPVVFRSMSRATLCPEIGADLAAETFAVVVRDLHRFDPQRGSAGAWVSGIARNQMRTWARRGVVDARARRRLGIVTPVFVESEETEINDELDAAPMYAAVQDALQSLSDTDRQVIHLRIISRLPYDEVGKLLGCTTGAARVRSSRALARLREAVDARPKVAGAG